MRGTILFGAVPVCGFAARKFIQLKVKANRPSSPDVLCPGSPGKLLKSLTLNAMKSPLVLSVSIVRFFTGLLFGFIDPI